MLTMKSEKEIREEIKATEKTIENYRNAYKRGDISFKNLREQLIDTGATIQTLRWVLGENDRYD